VTKVRVQKKDTETGASRTSLVPEVKQPGTTMCPGKRRMGKEGKGADGPIQDLVLMRKKGGGGTGVGEQKGPRHEGQSRLGTGGRHCRRQVLNKQTTGKAQT